VTAQPTDHLTGGLRCIYFVNPATHTELQLKSLEKILIARRADAYHLLFPNCKLVKKAWLIKGKIKDGLRL